MKKWTGERLETFVFNDVTVEHLHRYAIAKDLVKGKIVLDIACGEGYGSNLLAQNAHSVTGIDIDSTTISKAKAKYAAANLHFMQGEVENIPYKDRTFDVIVSFETLEHTGAHDKMILELKRVLKPNGIVVISTPHKLYYSDQRNYKNRFHVKELHKEEFQLLMSNHFKHAIYFEQRYGSSIMVPSNGINGITIYRGNYSAIEKEIYHPHYIITVASDAEINSIGFSIFDGNDVIEEAIEKAKDMVRETITYKAGHFLLYPFKKIRSIFRK